MAVGHSPAERAPWPVGDRPEAAGETSGEEEHAMSTKATTIKVSDSYLALVKEFPLVPIRHDDHLGEAVAMIHKLLRIAPDPGQEQYLDALSILVGVYEDEDEHHPIPDASESDVLRELMRSNSLSQTKLAKATGISQSTLSAVLNGARSLTRDQVVILARRFGVGPGAFLPG